jgi:decaheme cytochrome c component MtrC/MtrF-like protein
VIAQAACDSCHVKVQAHGGGRQAAEGCSICHTEGALDRAVGSKGRACTANAACPGFAAGWETCQDTNNDTVLDACVMTADPTPNQVVDFSQMIHDIHYARVRDGFSERNNLVNAGKLSIVGFQNSLLDFSEILLPQDIRNCTKCHADAAGTCNSSTPCGVGQACMGGTCRNVAWQEPSRRVCLSCHDSSAAYGHAQIMTYTDPATNEQIETCQVCHGAEADFAIEKVHNISNPYVPPYPRTKE